jgi:hypothetical protein
MGRRAVAPVELFHPERPWSTRADWASPENLGRVMKTEAGPAHARVMGGVRFAPPPR